MGFSVLIAEDDDDQRLLYTMLLTMKGFEVRPVADGKEAFDELLRQRPDVVLTDVSMPRMDGLELVKAVKGNERLSDLPIIVMTAYGKGYLTWAWALGANGAIAKPFEPDDLYLAVQKVLPQISGH